MSDSSSLTNDELSEQMLRSIGSSVSHMTLVQAVAAAASAVILGMIIVQASVYYRTFRDDSMSFKACVSFSVTMAVITFSLSLSQIVLILTHPYNTIATHWMRINFAAWLFTGLTTFVTQSFFALRLYRILRQPWWFVIVAVLMISSSLTSALLFCGYGWRLEHNPSLLAKIPTIGNLWIAITLVSDLLITGVMLWAIASNRGLSQHSDGWLYRVMFVVVESVTLPVVALTLYLITINVYNYNCASWDRVVGAIQCPLYAQAMIFSLNQRKAQKVFASQSSSGGKFKSTGSSQSATFWEEKGSGEDGIHVEREQVISCSDSDIHLYDVSKREVALTPTA